MDLVLSAKQREELLSELHLERHRKHAERIKVILLLDEGKSIAKIAEYLFLDKGTIRNYVKCYESGGLEELVSDNYTARSSYLTSRKPCL